MQSEADPEAAAAEMPWTERETRAFVSVWLETLLEKSGFHWVAEQMAIRGHNHSALECWAKITELRTEYRRVCRRNLEGLDEPPQTCPFYSELDEILQGDGIRKPSRTVQSFGLQVEEGGALAPMSADEARGSSSATSESPNRRECQNTPAPPTRNEQEVEDGEVGVAQLSPTSCPANPGTKRRCVSGPQSIAECMVAPPSKRHEEKPVGKSVRKSQRLAGRGGARKREEL
ncbi:uncharacterized protein LOC132572206 [Heteronotia binoei]|uniref:uncharacterized protein LOC132572206 n=1 Tax=Heteronotia binoei TaxID=13085 RepID=UPI00292EEA10|nr:uncharacterized protein LOC132572206 [Heteronotia binoei]